jgi:hypothetical protein
MKTLKEWVSIVERDNLYGTNNNKWLEEYTIKVESPITNYSYKVPYPLPYQRLSVPEYLIDKMIDFHKNHYYEYRTDCRVELKPVKPYLIQVTILVLYNEYTLAREDKTLEEFCININYFKPNNSITDLLENVFGEFSYRKHT